VTIKLAATALNCLCRKRPGAECADTALQIYGFLTKAVSLLEQDETKIAEKRFFSRNNVQGVSQLLKQSGSF